MKKLPDWVRRRTVRDGKLVPVITERFYPFTEIDMTKSENREIARKLGIAE